MNALSPAREKAYPAPDFDEVFVSHHRSVYRAAYALLRDAGLAEDVTQDVFLKLYHHLETLVRGFAPDADREESLRAWLLRVAVNDARNVLRGRARAFAREERFVHETCGDFTSNALDVDYERRIEIESARRTLARIEEPMRSCLLLKQQGLTYREIAAALELNETSVGTYVARGRKGFARIYGKIGGQQR
ncbi:MAG: RNA polymerase sigma factor SigX [Pyrinomonadaceae bacterium]